MANSSSENGKIVCVCVDILQPLKNTSERASFREREIFRERHSWLRQRLDSGFGRLPAAVFAAGVQNAFAHVRTVSFFTLNTSTYGLEPRGISVGRPAGPHPVSVRPLITLVGALCRAVVLGGYTGVGNRD